MTKSSARSSTSGGSSTSFPCLKCNQPVLDRQRASIQCNFCESWMHTDCGKELLGPKIYDYLRKPGIPYCCTSCAIGGKFRRLKEEVTDLKAENSQLRSELDELKLIVAEIRESGGVSGSKESATTTTLSSQILNLTSKIADLIA